MAESNQDQEPSSNKPDYGLFVGILFGIVSVFFFVLQSNGVEVNWLISSVIYVICTLALVWTILAHALPGKGKKALWVVIPLVLLCVVLGFIGTAKQFYKDHSATTTQTPQNGEEKPHNPTGDAVPLKAPTQKANPPSPTQDHHSKRGQLNPPQYSSRHILSEKERSDFAASLRLQTEPKEIISINCPNNEEIDCAYAVQFIDLFRLSGFQVDGNTIHRIILGTPFYGAVLGSHVDKDLDPNTPVGIGQWVAITPTSVSVERALAEVGVGSTRVSGAQVPAGTLEVYFGPERQPKDENDALQRSIKEVQKYDEAMKQYRASKSIKQQ
ncbi:MAG TPA: hypothetical protein VIY99_00270 [Terracidiphilus sp.]